MPDPDAERRTYVLRFSKAEANELNATEIAQLPIDLIGAINLARMMFLGAPRAQVNLHLPGEIVATTVTVSSGAD